MHLSFSVNLRLECLELSSETTGAVAGVPLLPLINTLFRTLCYLLYPPESL